MRIIRGKYGRRRFDVPRNISARPTTDFARENIFNVLENLVDFEQSDALDLFAGTGAISFEFLSRGCPSVTCVEKSATQYKFIRQVRDMLNATNLNTIRGDVFKYITTADRQFDIVFADPPYDLPNFAEVPQLVLNSNILKAGAIFILEHGKTYDFSSLPHFMQHRAYGSVNFSLFQIPEQ